MATSSGPPDPPVDPVPGRPDPGVPVLVLHVPRTGGSTLKFLLREAYGSDRTLLDVHRYPDDPWPTADYAVVEGHVAAPFYGRRFGAGWVANGVTILREPVARVVSQARHIRARPGPLQATLAAPVRDPADLFARVPRLADLQTKLLAGAPIEVPADEDTLARAVATLDLLAFGLTEALDATIALLSERFGFGAAPFGVSNAAAPTGDTDLRSEAFRTAAAAHNRFDRRLFDHARESFAARCEHLTATLLGLPLADAAASGALRYLRREATDAVRRPKAGVRGRLSGWILVDGRAPDAVVVRAGDSVVPAVPRLHRDEGARLTGRASDRRAGFAATLALPADATTVEVIAFDRARGRRASLTVPVTDAPRRRFGPGSRS